MANNRINKDRVLTQNELNHRYQDKCASIDDNLDEALKNIDFDRRKKAESSFYNWCCIYGYPLLLQKLPPPNAKLVLDKMESSLNMSKPIQIQLHRGAGKSCFAQLFLLYQICTLKRRFPIIVSANARAGNQLLNDIFRFITEDGTPFSVDYPSISLPFQIANGSYRRRQIYKGKPTNISKTSSDLSFADLDIEGQPRQSHICARGITSGLRGMRKGSLRVDSILLDDIIGDDDVTEEATNKVMDIIQKSILNLGGADKKIACCMTSTPIGPEDVTQRIRKDPNWITVCYPAIVQFGNIDTETWKRYWDMYDTESIEDKPHEESDRFYMEHRDELEEGFQLYNPDCYTKGENVSGVQSLMQKRHLIGVDAFDCEFQLKPKKFSMQVEVSARNVLEKIGSTSMLIPPEKTQIVVSSWDLNVSHALTNTIVSFDSHMSATILYHEVFKCHVSSKLPEIEYHQKVYELLTNYGRKVASLGVKIDYVGVDAGGANFNAVTDWCKHSKQLCGLLSCAFVGRASHFWNANVRSKLRSACGRTVLCGDEQEHLQNGSGRKWVAWDADAGKHSVLKAIIVPPYGLGGLMLYNGTPHHHQDFATQLTNEKLVFIEHTPQGKDIYTWKTKSAIDHDYLDTVAQAYAVAWSNSLGTDLQDGQVVNPRARIHLKRGRKRIRII